MSLKNMTLTAAATIAVSGGTPLVFAESGITITNGVQLIVPGDEDYTTRRSVTVKYRPPTITGKFGTYGKDKKTMVLVRPVVAPDGQIFFCTFRLERELHPSLQPTDALEMNNLAAQLITDPDAASFWATGATS